MPPATVSADHQSQADEEPLDEPLSPRGPLVEFDAPEFTADDDGIPTWEE